MIDMDLLKAIAQAISPEGGFYLEVGANDGILQSNSLVLEEDMGWTGVLIEASLPAFRQLQTNRPRNLLIQAALVPSTYQGSTIYGDFLDGSLISRSAAPVPHSPLTSLYLHYRCKLTRTGCLVPALALQTILRDHSITAIDFFSLDVEGSEVDVLMGMDLQAVRPKAILVEVRREILFGLCELLLRHEYQLLDNMSRFNVDSDPLWDGTHQDYLFVQKAYVQAVNVVLS